MHNCTRWVCSFGTCSAVPTVEQPPPSRSRRQHGPNFWGYKRKKQPRQRPHPADIPRQVADPTAANLSLPAYPAPPAPGSRQPLALTSGFDAEDAEGAAGAVARGRAGRLALVLGWGCSGRGGGGGWGIHWRARMGFRRPPPNPQNWIGSELLVVYFGRRRCVFRPWRRGLNGAWQPLRRRGASWPPSRQGVGEGGGVGVPASCVDTVAGLLASVAPPGAEGRPRRPRRRLDG